jgi:hypothetical protein
LKIVLFFGSLALALAADHPRIGGIWQSADNAETVTIQQNGDDIEITQAAHEKQADIRCNTIGKSCKVKGGEVSFWYNGGVLVMIESLHGSSKVTEKRWTISADGKTLNLEIVRISPAGSPEKIAYNRKNGS